MEEEHWHAQDCNRHTEQNSRGVVVVVVVVVGVGATADDVAETVGMTTEDVRLVGMQAVVGVVLDHDSLAAHQHLCETKQSLAA